MVCVLLMLCVQVLEQYDYQLDCIYLVWIGLGIIIQIEFSLSEKIFDYSIGFSSGWELNCCGNVFYFKLKNVDVDINMMVCMEIYLYIFELKVVVIDWKMFDQVCCVGV